MYGIVSAVDDYVATSWRLDSANDCNRYLDFTPVIGSSFSYKEKLVKLVI